MQRDFLAIDKDQQGTISLAELQDVMVRIHGVSESDAAEMFNAMDANHDHEIHYSEFLAAMLSTSVDPKSVHVDNAFRNFDTDLSGYITADNLRDVFGNNFEGKQVESLLSEADFLADGRISFDEFVAFVCDLPFDPAALRSYRNSGVPYTPKHHKVPQAGTSQLFKMHRSSNRKATPTEQCCAVM